MNVGFFSSVLRQCLVFLAVAMLALPVRYLLVRTRYGASVESVATAGTSTKPIACTAVQLPLLAAAPAECTGQNCIWAKSADGVVYYHKGADNSESPLICQ